MKDAKELVVKTVKQFATEHGFTQVNPRVKMNKNDYPFITFVNPTKPAGEQAENIYLSKRLAEGVKAGDSATEILKIADIGYTTNEAGEQRIKLVNQGRIELADLF